MHAFYNGTRQDAETEWARKHSKSFTQGTNDIAEWTDAIVGAGLDILIYPEIGMDPTTVKLASLRLAPIQVGTWGHPETTGLPNIDYYLSAEAFEPADATENYTENLIQLPHIGCCYAPLSAQTATVSLGDLGLEHDVPLLLCPGAPFKYTPWNDHLLIDIARRLEDCRFVFFRYHTPELTEKLQQRLQALFTLADLDSSRYVRFIPWQDSARFFGLMNKVDLFLDTVGFSGFNTAIQAVENGLPIVTLEGRFMRGRLASGILRRIGLDELVATNREDYVRMAVRLAQDKDYRESIKSRMAQQRHLLFNDLTPIHALEAFLIEATTRHRAGLHQPRDS